MKRPQVCLGRTLHRNKEKRLSRVSFYRLIHRSIELFAPGKSILYSSLSARRLFNRRKIHKRKNSQKRKDVSLAILSFIMSFICYIKSIHRFLFSSFEVFLFLETMRIKVLKKCWWWKIWNCEIIDSFVCSIRNSFIALT